jgi:hypothetical protein
VGKALNSAGIPVLLFKGAAMKALRPLCPRPMNDVDFLVPPERFTETVALGKSLGYRDSLQGAKHAVDLLTAEGEPALDIHHSIFLNAAGEADINKNIFARAQKRRVFGVDALLPAHEDLFFIVLVNLIRNLRDKSSVKGLFYALFDCKFLLAKPGFNWAIVRENAQATNNVTDARFAVEYLNSLVPGIIPAEVENCLPLTRDMEIWCDRLLFDEYFLVRRRQVCQEIRVVDLKNYPLLYGKMILSLLALKKLRVFPRFVRWYLASHGCGAGRIDSAY